MLSSRPFHLLNSVRDLPYDENVTRFTASKTPGRALKGRAGLQENVLRQGYSTADPKEKRTALKTPFRAENKILLNDDPASLKPHGAIPQPRPFGDKTPAPNRLPRESSFTPLTRAGKFGKLQLPSLIDEPEHTTPPPSSSRKKLRVPRSSNIYKTPITNADHWNVSDVSIDFASSSLEEVMEDDLNEPDYSEPEYMPPTALESPYEPPFPLPNYREVGTSLLKSARAYAVEVSPTMTKDYDSDEILGSGGWSPSLKVHGLELPVADEDDPFGLEFKKAASIRVCEKSNMTTRSAAKRATSTRSNGTLTSRDSSRQGQVSSNLRPATSMLPRGPTGPQRASSTVTRRPATALSTTTKTNTRLAQRLSATSKGKNAPVKAAELAKGDNILNYSTSDLTVPDDDFRFAM